MDDSTSQTPSASDNRLGLMDNGLINEYEAKGIAAAELFVFSLDSEMEVSASLIMEIHRIAFSELYEWAGKWRTIEVIVGQLSPPRPHQVHHLMYQYIDEMNHRIAHADTAQTHLTTLVYAHYEFIRIHPFNNGNGRTGRILMNLVALKFGYRPLVLYHREGDSRRVYIDAMKAADKGDFGPLTDLIRIELAPF